MKILTQGTSCSLLMIMEPISSFWLSLKHMRSWLHPAYLSTTSIYFIILYLIIKCTTSPSHRFNLCPALVRFPQCSRQFLYMISIYGLETIFKATLSTTASLCGLHQCTDLDMELSLLFSAAATTIKHNEVFMSTTMRIF